MRRVHYVEAGHTGVMMFPMLSFTKEQALAKFKEVHPDAAIIDFGWLGA